MEITEHQANMLRALADRKTLQFREKSRVGTTDFGEEFANLTNLHSALLFIDSDKYEVRIKPDVIIVNGIGVPAPEKESFLQGESYYLACPSREEGWMQSRWRGDDEDKLLLRLQILHCSPEAAGAHGKAMRAHKPG